MVVAGSIKEILPGKKEDLSHQIGDVKNVDEIRVNVFIHGTYEVGTIPLNFFTSFWDKDLKGTVHEKIVRDFMRKQARSTYEISLMYYEGLYRVDVSGESDSLKKLEDLALLPIIKSFDAVGKDQDSKLRPNEKIIDIDYLFGWSGLLNAQARREAGICLFNALSAEKEKIENFIAENKSKTKIIVKLFCHSHGGGVALNSAWADAFSREDSAINFYNEFELGEFGQEAQSKFDDLIAKIPENYVGTIGKSPYGMDNWLFKPRINKESEPLVDELFLVASPIQPETWPLIFSGTFTRVISFFSLGDNIQNLDMISTRNRASDRFISDGFVEKGNRLFSKDEHPKFVQINVVLPSGKDCQVGKNSCQKKSWLKNKISKFVAGSRFIPEIKGPRHLEFWYICWQGISDRLCIRPAPIVVFATLINKPWLLGSKFLIQFSTSEEGDLLIKSLDSENDRGFRVLSACQKELFEGIKNEFFDRSERLQNIGNIEKMALFMATS